MMRIALFHGFLFLVLACPVVQADIYQFVDEDGVVHFSNVPSDNRYQRIETEGIPAKNPGPLAPGESSVFRLDQASRFQEHVMEASALFSIPTELIKAVMAVESNFNSRAVSHAGAQGLMQLMPATARQMGVRDSFDPRQNILGGTRYLRMMANAFDGDIVLTLAAYNAGHRAVTKHGDVPPFAETQQYVRRVLRLYYHYKNQDDKPTLSKPGEDPKP